MKVKNHIIKNKGFTLIELLVVVAIIGILAAVGVVAYSGYVTSAKKSAAKNNHSLVVRYIANNLKNCELGKKWTMVSGRSVNYVEDDPDSEDFGQDVSEPGSLACEERKDEDVVSEALVDAIGPDIQNPYGGGTALLDEKPEVSATEDCTAKQLGIIWVDNSTAEKVSITTCFAEKSNPLTANLNVD